MKPTRLAVELGISDKTLRAWLRRAFPRNLADKNSSWSMTSEQVAAAQVRWGGMGRATLTPTAPPTVPPVVAKPETIVASVSPDAEVLLTRLNAGAAPISEATSYSEKPGIYGVFFLGDDFPLSNAGITKGTLAYIGKTESSQLTRDLKQHLADGETGHSTLRRTLAALLRTKMALRPVPRSKTEQTDRRFTHYKLDDEGERKLTTWMRANLGLAFLPCDCTIAEIRRLEDEMIRAAIPVLNLLGNPKNPHLRRIKAARAECVELARRAGSPN